ncbi:MAG: hypothetical protein FJZ00_06365 [Candidatus Sericytochromatia bacterium]|uniref:Uncharacterized protein n=1 Tax=Candidatus Tanganyikabacteria bacterium TaxID=2961651 RepID=A0A937X6Z1_9BACT|nr:hypothetical protein [Candidatus Tanganyikabacteria bacterium]
MRPLPAAVAHAGTQAHPRSLFPFPLPSLGNLPVDIKVGRSGSLEATTSLLGLLPVKVSVDPEKVLAGRYGRQMTVNLMTPGKAILTGDMQVEGFPVPEVTLDDQGLGQGFKNLQFYLVADHQVHIDGIVRLGPFELPFQADAFGQKTGNGLYDFSISNVALFGSWKVPTWFATWLARMVVAWATPANFLGRPAPDRISVDLRSAFNGEDTRTRDA